MILQLLLLAVGATSVPFAGPNAALKSCFENTLTDRGSFAFAGDLFYDHIVNRYNLNIPVTPAAMTFPTSSQQVAAIVKCAAEHGFPVQARSGGHSYGNYGLGGTDGAVAIDLKHLRQFSMDNTTWQATIGAGSLLSDVTQRLYHAGGRSMSHGICPQVGSGGHFTIGGLGPTSRQFGAALDHVLEVEVVLANSSIVRASDTENQDLFWAIKGAASGYGIVTEFKVRTEPEPGTAVQYAYSLEIGSPREQAALFKSWQAFVSDPNLTRKMASTLTVLEHSMAISGTFFGTKEEYDKMNLSSKFPGANGKALVFNDWLGIVAHWAEDLVLKLGAGIPTNFYAKSTSWTPQTLMTPETIDRMFDYIGTVNKGTLGWFLLFDFQGGYTSDIPINATSYAHRDVLIWLQSYTLDFFGHISQTQVNFLDGLHKIVTNDNIPYAAYPGYVDPLMSNAPEAYWGTNLPRLQQIKKQVDPRNVFRNPQSPTPAIKGESPSQESL
ncbi:FAD linked oxidase N-terminal [Penicillium coprophilum]|uniref:FAD linked oxidase N-terminal n=1 Tax=Penicillium coprophilum TaxID=36646 RepID=UPI0023A6C9F1|nr:FAD linked oxidase N-terminal [Penicillium coprophilum]KAJ5163979.1 FAD linked oxidase N-terminal [Penicillium coprophilum]